MTRLAASVTFAVILVGCAHQPPPTTRPSLATTQPYFWVDQPAAVQIVAVDFQRLWDACEEAAREYNFILSRQDYRNGVITTNPLISKQWFEIWRNDVQTGEDLADSSIATYRRTLRFEFERQQDGRFASTPKVVIERYAQAERPITSSVYLRNTFRTQRNYHPVGSAEADVGVYLPQRYWYPTGRDIALEKDIARHVQHRLDEP